MLPLTLAPPRGRPLRVLCLGAHSDDIEIGCGGTMLALRRRRPAPEIRWVVFSGDARRAREARTSARLFLGRAGVAALTTHPYRDGYFPSHFEAIKDEVQALAAAWTPDVVFTHARDDRHQDHRVISDLTWNAFRDQLVLEYEVPKWDGDLGRPNLYVSLAARDHDRKVDFLMRAFATQRSKDWFTPDTFHGLARLRGVECRAASGVAEAFCARKVMAEVAR